MAASSSPNDPGSQLTVSKPSLTQSALMEPLHWVMLVVWLLSALFVLGLPLAVTAGVTVVLELAYLFGFARTPAYARRVNLKWGQEQLALRNQAIEQRAASLRMDDRRRFNAIQKAFQGLMQKLDDPNLSKLLPSSIERTRLEALREAALDFCLASQGFREHLNKTDLQQLEASIRQSAGATEAERTTRDLQQQRLDGLRRMQAQLTELDGQLTVIEQTFALLKEQISALSASTATTDLNSRLGDRVTHLSQDVEATRRTLAEMRSLEQSGRF